MQASRTGSILDIVFWLFQSSLWWMSGWFLAKYLFKLRSRELLFTGLAIGMLLFIVLSNLLAQFLNLGLSFWVSAGLLFTIGLVTSRGQFSASYPSIKGLRSQIGLVIAFIFLLLLFTRINTGLSIFDDNNNLPLVSRLSAGDFPPHFYLNPEQRLDYHYGLHLFAASLVQVGGLYPWSALDFTKALTLTTLSILTWMWFRRLVRPRSLAVFGLLFVLLATGTRWLLLVIPEGQLALLSSQVQLTGSALTSGPELFRALVSPWIIEGGSPIPFPFAFSNGIIPPVILAMTGYGALPYLTAIILIMLLRRDNTAVQKFFLGLLLSSLAITGEHLLLMVWTGILLAILLHWLVIRPTRSTFLEAIHWGWFFIPSLTIALVGGGVLTEFIHRSLFPAANFIQQPGIGFGGISLRIPLGLTSAHLGVLKITNPSQVLVALMEMGPVLIMAIPVFIFFNRRFKSNEIRYTGLSLAAAIGLFIPLVIQLTLRDRDISRMTGMAIFLLMILGLPLTVIIYKKANNLVKTLLLSAYAISIIGGIALLPSLLVAIANPQPSYFISQLDQQVTNKYWNSLETDAAIFDPAHIYRPAVIFAGSAGRAYQDIFTPYPDFEILLSNPDPLQAANYGYDYYYLDMDTWQKLSVAQRSAFLNDCVRRHTQISSEDGDFRTLYDIRQCRE